MPENDRGAFVGAVESVLASIPATRMPELPINKKKEAITIREYRKLPNELPLTIPPDWEALTHVDATPDKEYVLRILRAHLSNCEARWSGSESELKKYMNKQQDERAKLLKAAIIVLAAPKEELENSGEMVGITPEEDKKIREIFDECQHIENIIQKTPFSDLLNWYQHDATVSTTLTIEEVANLYIKSLRGVK